MNEIAQIFTIITIIFALPFLGHRERVTPLVDARR